MTSISYQMLRKRVESRLGLAVSSARDCATLQQVLRDVVDAKVSVTTIKRFWGIVVSDVKPSRYTLNALSRYVGYRDFAEFDQAATSSDEEESPVWERYRSVALELSSFCFNSFKSRMGHKKYSCTLHRSFTREFFDGFRKSGKVATALVAPAGWGKSTCMAHIVDEYFMSGGAPCYGDLLFYFNLDTIGEISKYKQLMEDLYVSMLGDSGQYNFKSVFMRNAGWRKGDIYILVDDIKTVSQLNYVNALAGAYANEEWFHLLFTIDSGVWVEGCHSISSNARSLYWNLDCLVGDTSYHNVPVLDMRERFQLLVNNGILNVEVLRMLYSDEASVLLGIPEFSGCMVDLCHEGKVSMLELLWDIFKRRVVSRIAHVRLSAFLNILMEESDMGRRSEFRLSSNLQKFIMQFGDVFESFRAAGTIEVCLFNSETLSADLVIKFVNSHFFEFVVASYWINHYGKAMDSGLLRQVSDFYGTQYQLKFRIMRWLVRYAFREGLVESINSVFQLSGEAFGGDASLVSGLRNLVCAEFSMQPDLRGRIMNTDEEMRYYLLEYVDLDHLDGLVAQQVQEFLSRPSCAGWHLNAHLLRLYSYYLHGDAEAFGRCYQIMMDMEEARPSHSDVDYLMEFIAHVMYESISGGSVQPRVIRYVEDYASRCFADVGFCRSNLQFVGFIMFDVLVLTRHYGELYRLSSQILGMGDGASSDFVFNALKFVNLISLYYTGRTAEAQEAFLAMSIGHGLKLLPFGQFFFAVMRVSILFVHMAGSGYRLPIKTNLDVVISYRDMLLHLFHQDMVMRYLGSDKR